MKLKKLRRKSDHLAYELKQRHLFDVERESEDDVGVSGAWSYALIDTLAGIIACSPDPQDKLDICTCLLKKKVNDHLEKFNA